MKTATLPSLRVAPELRNALETVLQPGETVSGFVEAAVRQQIESRQTQQAFIERGLAAAAAAKQSNDYVPADAVLAQMQAKLDAKRNA
ncbi:YlcI/YnfO family protein [Andreprevotia chitinilytica]|uniref:YlcI/YnfO family protein n=1 Tax=Andreprevotia chitinilytica TaxID=396808 RepID=UPI0005540FC4|nr:YlcI/YnfO family protein [Andreprevotia chitinilytica]